MMALAESTAYTPCGPNDERSNLVSTDWQHGQEVMRVVKTRLHEVRLLPPSLCVNRPLTCILYALFLSAQMLPDVAVFLECARFGPSPRAPLSRLL